MFPFLVLDDSTSLASRSFPGRCQRAPAQFLQHRKHSVPPHPPSQQQTGEVVTADCQNIGNIAHLRQECHNSKSVIFQEKLLKVLKCYNFL